MSTGLRERAEMSVAILPLLPFLAKRTESTPTVIAI